MKSKPYLRCQIHLWGVQVVVKKHLGAPEILMVPKTSIGAFTGAWYKEHVKCTKTKSSTPDVLVTIRAIHRINDVSSIGKMSQNSSALEIPMPHWSNASDLLMWPRHLSEDSTVTSGHSLTEKSDSTTSEVLMPYTEKGQWLQTVSSTWWPI